MPHKEMQADAVHLDPLGQPVQKPLAVLIVPKQPAYLAPTLAEHPAGDEIDRARLFYPQVSSHARMLPQPAPIPQSCIGAIKG